MEEKDVAELIKDLVINNCIDVEDEDRGGMPEVDEIMTIENSPYAATVIEEGCYMTLPNGKRFLIYVKEA
jgi:hypothetical protein